MSKILNISDRLESKRRKKQLESHRVKLEAIHRIVQCASCRFRCAMCGQHFDTDNADEVLASTQMDFRLCENCGAEYEDFLELTGEAEISDVFCRANLTITIIGSSMRGTDGIIWLFP